jgi:hypothetical protein
VLKRLLLLSIAFLLLLPANALAKSNFIKSSIPSEVIQENNPNYELQYQIVIENIPNGSIYRLDLDGSQTVLGNVLIPATATYTASDGFWAAQYTRANDDNMGSVVASGVNAMHLRVGTEDWYDPELAQQGRFSVPKPQLISLLPDREYNKSGPGPHPGRISTNIPGGKKLFGGASSTYVGSPVKYLNPDGQWEPIEVFYRNNGFETAPQMIMIEVSKPYTDEGSPEEIIFENRVGGVVSVHYPNGISKDVATVLQRVEGTGRFGGSEYADVGYLRANHGGVIDLSTSPYVGFTWDNEKRGGFQIVPANHAVYSRHFLDLNYIDRPQYMIVGALGSTPDRLLNPVYYDENGLAYEPHLEAVAPLFGGYIKPKYVTNLDFLPPEQFEGEYVNNPAEEVIKDLSTHFQLSYDGGATWIDPPSLTGTINDSLINVTHIKLKLRY